MSAVGTSLLALALGLAPPESFTVGGGSLLVSPHRLVLEEPEPRPRPDPARSSPNRGRSAELLLMNGGSETGTYRISMVNMEMGEDGRIHEKPKAAGELAAEDLIRYSPRQVVLAPGATQTVRLQVRKPSGLAPGEYRSHMVFRAVPAAGEPRQGGQTEAPAEKAFSVNLKVIYGLSIPIIIRHGATHASADLTQLQLEPPPQAGAPSVLQVRLNRAGNKSVFGDLVATWIPRSGPPRPVGQIRSVAVYAQLAHRDLALGLSGLPAKEREPGTLKVEFVDRESGKVLAKATLELPAAPPS